MGLDYSQKRLLGAAFRKKGSGGRHATLSGMKRRGGFPRHLEVYAFWTGFASTLVSVMQVVITAFKK